MGDLIAEALAEVDDSTLFALFVGTICGCSGALAVVLAGFCWHSCARAGQQCRLLCTFGLLFMAATIVTATWLVWWWWRPVAQPGASECEEELRVAERRLVALEAESSAEADADGAASLRIRNEVREAQRAASEARAACLERKRRAARSDRLAALAVALLAIIVALLIRKLVRRASP